MPKALIIISILVVFVLIAGAGSFIMLHGSKNNSYYEPAETTSLIDSKTLGSLDKESNSLISTAHLANGLTPPTNKWYSGMVLNNKPQPGFNVPNSILPSNDGFELGLPHITSSSDGIYGPHVSGIQLSAQNATTYKLTRYDELTITLTYYNESGNELFDVTFASGSPYGFVVAKQDIEINLKSGPIKSEAGGITTFNNGDAWYGAKASTGKTGASLKLHSNDELAVFSASKQTDLPVLAKQAAHRITSGKVSYRVQDSLVKTALHYNTKQNGQTVLVRMPQQSSSPVSPAVSYSSLYGKLSGYVSSEIGYSVSSQPLKWSLDMDGITSDKKSSLKAQLAADIASTKLNKNDTYFGTKQLQRLAQLVMVADSLGENELRTEALNKLMPGLAAWFDSDDMKSFYYDKTAKTIVGREASFGSDKELNDHHFHYGYFIYAASVASKFDKSFLKDHKKEVNMLTADIANYKSNESLPLRRNYDAYVGHSWASGIANYSDGNNQESSSEAVNAWTGVSLWADVTSNDALRNEAAWLLANEIGSAQKYWLTKPTQDGYAAPLVSINWGGKREYKTFFSDEANPKLAVQLLPLNPSMKHYIATVPELAYKGTDTNKQYGDYILMAKSGSEVFKAAMNYPDSLVDDGNSKSYMMAYLLSK